MTVTWRVIDPCPVQGPDGEMCSGERDHEPLGPIWGNAEHWCTAWRRGHMLSEPITWSTPTTASEEFS